MLFDPGFVELVTQAEDQGQVGADLEVILLLTVESNR
jgi:hypothetical protein